MIDPIGFLLSIFLNLWWLLLPFLLTQIVWEKYLSNKESEFRRKNFNYAFFEIIFPEVTLKTPKLMEIVFDNLHASAKKIKKIETILEGKVPLPYALYLWFHDRKLSFYIAFPTAQKEFVKASFYTAYPELKLKEIENPWKAFSFNIPNPIYDTFLVSFKLKTDDYVPLKTYEYLEKLPPEERIDPASAFWELKEHISNKEWLILGIFIFPILGDDETYGKSWIKRGQKAIDKIIGKPEEPSPFTFWQQVEEFAVNLLKAIYTYPTWKTPPSPQPFEFNIQKLTPQQRELLEAIQNKIKKRGFLCYLKATYIASKEILTEKRVKELGGALVGALNHFSTEDLNGFKPSILHDIPPHEVFGKFKAFFLKFDNFDKSRKMKDLSSVKDGFVLNSAELATIFHHPLVTLEGVSKIKEEPGLYQVPLV